MPIFYYKTTGATAMNEIVLVGDGRLVWETRDRRRIAVEDMKNGHLKNARAFCIRCSQACIARGDITRAALYQHAVGVFAAELRRRGWDAVEDGAAAITTPHMEGTRS